MVFGGSQWLPAVLNCSQWFLVLFGGSERFLMNSQWFSTVFSGSQLLQVFLSVLRGFSLVLNDYQ